MSNLEAAFAGVSSSNNTNDNNDNDDEANMWIQAPFSSTSKLHTGLATLETLMRCSICCDLLQIPVSLIPCHHTFCKHCFDSYAKASMRTIKRKINCPTCRMEVPTKDLGKSLITNSVVEEMIHVYKTIRPDLKASLLLGVAVSTGGASGGVGGNSSDDNNNDDNNNDDNNSSNNSANERGRKRGRRNYSEMDDTNNDDDAAENNDNSENYQGNTGEVLQPMMDNHQTEGGVVSLLEPSSFAKGGLKARHKKSKTTYHALKKKQLKEICAKEGLPITGTDAELKNRHDAYISLYNAECDSTRPRSPGTLRQEVLKDERERKKAAAKSSKDTKCMEQLKKRQADAAAADADSSNDDAKQAPAASTTAYSGDAAFDAELKTGFAGLLAGLKARQPPRDKTARTDTEEGFDQVGATAAIVATATAATPAALRENPCKKIPSSASPYLSTVSTPAGAPNLFAPGSNAPSTISHKQSQNAFPLLSQGTAATAGHALDKIAKAGAAASSPIHADGSDSAIAVDSTQESATATGNASETPVRSTRASRHAVAEELPPAAAASTHSSRSKRRRKTAAAATGNTSRRGGRPTKSGPWICTGCTWHNEKSTWTTANCEMCKSSRLLYEECQVAPAQPETTVSF